MSRRGMTGSPRRANRGACRIQAVRSADRYREASRSGRERVSGLLASADGYPAVSICGGGAGVRLVHFDRTPQCIGTRLARITYLILGEHAGTCLGGSHIIGCEGHTAVLLCGLNDAPQGIVLHRGECIGGLAGRKVRVTYAADVSEAIVNRVHERRAIWCCMLDANHTAQAVGSGCPTVGQSGRD